MATFVITAYDIDAAPLAGLVPTWYSYKTIATGADAAQPVIAELSGGLYKTDVPDTEAGILDFGATAYPRYVAVCQESLTWITFAAYTVLGTPLTGLTPTWANLVLVSDGSAYAQPAIAEIGGGLYRFVPVTPLDHVAGMLLLTGASPEYLQYDSSTITYTVTTVIKMNTPVLMRGYDGTLLAEVYWMANTIDSTGAEYAGPGPLTDIVVVKLMQQLGGGSGQPAYFYAIADAAIDDGAPVYEKDDSTPGTPAVAEADATTEAMARVVGIASGSAADDGQVMVIVAGETNVPDTIWTGGVPVEADVGKYVYLASLPGVLTLTAPTTSTHTVIKVGVVTRGGAGAVRIDVQIGDGLIITQLMHSEHSD